MLENFTPTINSDNRIQIVEEDIPDELIIGGTCTYVFNVPFVYSSYVKQLEFNFKQGLTIILTKTAADCKVTELSDGTSSLILVLSADETSLFKQNYLDTYVQLKILNNKNEVIYDVPSKLVIHKPLDRLND